jgi:hypothetical protein
MLISETTNGKHNGNNGNLITAVTQDRTALKFSYQNKVGN